MLDDKVLIGEDRAHVEPLIDQHPGITWNRLKVRAHMRFGWGLVVALGTLAVGLTAAGDCVSAAQPAYHAPAPPKATPAPPKATPVPPKATPVPSPIAEATAAALRAAIAKSKNDARTYELGLATVWTGVVKNIALDLGAIVVALLVVALLFGNIRRIWSAVTTGAISITLGPFGAVSIPAIAAAAQQRAGTVTPPPPSAPAATAGPPAPRPPGPTSTQIAAATTIRSLVHETGDAASLVEALSAKQPLLAAVAPDGEGQSWPADIENYYRTFFRSLLRSQYKLLEDLAAGTPISLADARARFDNAGASATKISFDTWLRYPQRYGMLVPPRTMRDLTERLVITQRGRDFVDWSHATGHGDDQIVMEGRDY